MTNPESNLPTKLALKLRKQKSQTSASCRCRLVKTNLNPSECKNKTPHDLTTYLADERIQ